MADPAALPLTRPQPPVFPVAKFLACGLAAAALLLAALQIHVAVAGALYVSLFVVVAWARPEVALLLIFASSPFQNDLAGGGPVKFSLAELNLALALPVMLVRNLVAGRPLRYGPVAVPVLIYLAVCLAASLLNWRGKTTIVSLAQMGVYMVAAVVVFASSVSRLEKLLVPLAGLLCVGVFFGILVIAVGRPFGIHKNGLGATLSVVAAVGLELWFAARTKKRKRFLAAAAVVVTVGLMCTLSRGAWIAALGGVFVVAVLRQQYRLVFRSALVLVPFLAVGWILLPEESTEYATDFSTSARNINARLQSIEFAMAQFRSNPVLGTGVGLRKEFDATNIVMTVLAETGVIGLIAFGAIHVVILRMAWQTQKRLSRSDPKFSLVAIGGALIVGRLLHGLVDHYWSRGAVSAAWAGVGMATAVYFATGGTRPSRASRRAEGPASAKDIRSTARIGVVT